MSKLEDYSYEDEWDIDDDYQWSENDDIEAMLDSFELKGRKL